MNIICITVEVHLMLQLHIAEIAELWTTLLGILEALVPEAPCHILNPVVSFCAALHLAISDLQSPEHTPTTDLPAVVAVYVPRDGY